MPIYELSSSLHIAEPKPSRDSWDPHSSDVPQTLRPCDLVN